MDFWAGFNKFVGVQGILAMALGLGYVVAAFVYVELPTGYTELMALVFGFYFAKNGPNALAPILSKAVK